MSFQEEVKRTRQKVLDDKKYSIPIQSLQNRVRAYEMEKTLEEKQAEIANVSKIETGENTVEER